MTPRPTRRRSSSAASATRSASSRCSETAASPAPATRARRRPRGDRLVFLNNDTEPRAGLARGAGRLRGGQSGRPTVVGAKLLYPTGAIQHAGVVFGQDGYPHNLYAGFPADHPAVNHSRRLQAVTAACALVRRDAFERRRGFRRRLRELARGRRPLPANRRERRRGPLLPRAPSRPPRVGLARAGRPVRAQRRPLPASAGATGSAATTSRSTSRTA